MKNFKRILLLFTLWVLAEGIAKENTNQVSSSKQVRPVSFEQEVSRNQTQKLTVTAKSSKKIEKSKAGGKRKPSSGPYKEDVFGADYYTPPRSVSQNIEQIKEHLHSLENLCKTQKNLEEKLAYVEQAIGQLKTLAEQTLEVFNIRSEDERFLLKVKDLAAAVNRGRPISSTFPTGDIRQTFEQFYRMHVRFPESDGVEDFPDLSARQIYKGLDCLYQSL